METYFARFDLSQIKNNTRNVVSRDERVQKALLWQFCRVDRFGRPGENTQVLEGTIVYV
jgi:hypothetical protein